MPDANVDALKRSYESLNRGDIAAALDVLDPDAEWHESSALPDTGSFRGRQEIEAFLVEYLESWDEFQQEMEELVAAGDKVAVFLHLTARGRASGVAVDQRYAHVWTMRDGKGVCVDAYYDRDQALARLDPEPG
jgi:ketosteroid isomerase-like protein